jgi:hypothetical protein
MHAAVSGAAVSGTAGMKSGVVNCWCKLGRMGRAAELRGLHSYSIGSTQFASLRGGLNCGAGSTDGRAPKNISGLFLG